LNMSHILRLRVKAKLRSSLSRIFAPATTERQHQRFQHLTQRRFERLPNDADTKFWSALSGRAVSLRAFCRLNQMKHNTNNITFLKQRPGRVTGASSQAVLCASLLQNFSDMPPDARFNSNNSASLATRFLQFFFCRLVGCGFFRSGYGYEQRVFRFGLSPKRHQIDTCEIFG